MISLLASVGSVLRFIMVPAAPLILITAITPRSFAGRIAVLDLLLMAIGSVIGLMIYRADVDRVQSFQQASTPSTSLELGCDLFPVHRCAG